MKGRAILLAALATTTTMAQDTVSVPWAEFSEIYRAHITRQVLDGLPKEEPKPECPRASLEAATYRLSIEGDRATGHVALTGEAIEGKPRIQLFHADVIPTAVAAVSGGRLERVGDTIVLESEGTGPLTLELDFLLTGTENNGQTTFRFDVPPAMRNSLRIELADGLELVTQPGILHPDGSYRFSAGRCVTITTRERGQTAAEALPSVDILTHITPLRGRLQMDLWLAGEGTHDVLIPPEARPIAAPDSPDYRLVGSGVLRTELTRGKAGHVTLNIPAAADGQTVDLPHIEGNTGAQGWFTIEEPEDSRVAVTGNGLVQGLPRTHLPSSLQACLGSGTCAYLPPKSQLALAITHFTPVASPEFVLETVEVACAFEEAGNSLTTIRLKLPPDAGNRLSIPAVAAARIWSLRVNGKSRQVYSGEDARWIVPLDEGSPSAVELAFVREATPLGLHGTLQALIPELGMAAARLIVQIQLPERVALTSLEGPVSPAPRCGGTASQPGCYTFARDFYGGMPLTLGIAYREPVTNE